MVGVEACIEVPEPTEKDKEETGLPAGGIIEEVGDIVDILLFIIVLLLTCPLLPALWARFDPPTELLLDMKGEEDRFKIS